MYGGRVWGYAVVGIPWEQSIKKGVINRNAKEMKKYNVYAYNRYFFKHWIERTLARARVNNILYTFYPIFQLLNICERSLCELAGKTIFLES